MRPPLTLRRLALGNAWQNLARSASLTPSSLNSGVLMLPAISLAWLRPSSVRDSFTMTEEPERLTEGAA